MPANKRLMKQGVPARVHGDRVGYRRGPLRRQAHRRPRPGRLLRRDRGCSSTVHGRRPSATSDARVVVMHERDFRAMEEEMPEVAERIRRVMESAGTRPRPARTPGNEPSAPLWKNARSTSPHASSSTPDSTSSDAGSAGGRARDRLASRRSPPSGPPRRTRAGRASRARARRRTSRTARASRTSCSPRGAKAERDGGRRRARTSACAVGSWSRSRALPARRGPRRPGDDRADRHVAVSSAPARRPRGRAASARSSS